MSGQPKTEPIVVGSVADLVAFARAGEKPRAAFRVGTEHEKIGIRTSDFRPVPYQGEDGIEGLLAAIAAQDGWTPVREGDALVALEKDGASITLEPGGQLELSGAPLRTIFETCREFHHHLDLLRRVSEPRGIAWLSLGANPLHDVDEIPRVPKARYAVMRRFLPPRGELALHMMHLTATVQANLDYASEEDMAAKMRAAMGVSPIVSALFANSSLYLGKPSGWVSRRVHIWRHVDPDRCGMLPFVFEPDFGYERYVEWALDVPMFFVLRGGRYLPSDGMTFRRFLAEGHALGPATLQDWNLHLTTLFPEVRLKQFLEVRGADAVPSGLICALAGWVLIGRVGAVAPTSGQFANIESITAVVIGGISLFGGRGSILGMLFGALIVGVFGLGLRLLGTDPQWTYLLIGVLIISAVAIDQWIRKVAG